MFTYQTTGGTVNLMFSKEYLSSPEVIKFIETLRIKELLSTSQLCNDDVMALDDELKESWWQVHKDDFLQNIQ
ncbi:MAG: hypothetical protein QX191_08900 [Methylococcaceae bacterium]